MKSPFPPLCEERYEAIEILGSGGFGTVVLARDRKHDRPVAVKLLHAEGLRDPGVRERLEREAQVTARLHHPKIVRLLDFQVEEGVPWVVYEYLPGRSLGKALLEGPTAWEVVVRVLGDVADALACAHRERIYHRDIKPDNILETGGDYRLIDFGIARWVSAGGIRTSAGMVLGTPAYMAPELLRGHEASAASDLYSLGITAFELLTGKPPFVSTDINQVVQAHLSQEPPDVRRVAPGVPPALAAIVRRLLLKDPAARLASAGDLMHALEATASASMETPGVTRVIDVVAEPAQRERSVTGGRSLPAALLAAFAVLASAAVMFFARSPPPAPSSPPPSASPADTGELAEERRRFEDLLRRLPANYAEYQAARKMEKKLVYQVIINPEEVMPIAIRSFQEVVELLRLAPHVQPAGDQWLRIAQGGENCMRIARALSGSGERLDLQPFPTLAKLVDLLGSSLEMEGTVPCRDLALGFLRARLNGSSGRVTMEATLEQVLAIEETFSRGRMECDFSPVPLLMHRMRLLHRAYDLARTDAVAYEIVEVDRAGPSVELIEARIDRIDREAAKQLEGAGPFSLQDIEDRWTLTTERIELLHVKLDRQQEKAKLRGEEFFRIDSMIGTLEATPPPDLLRPEIAKKLRRLYVKAFELGFAVPRIQALVERGAGP